MAFCFSRIFPWLGLSTLPKLVVRLSGCRQQRGPARGEHHLRGDEAVMPKYSCMNRRAHQHLTRCICHGQVFFCTAQQPFPAQIENAHHIKPEIVEQVCLATTKSDCVMPDQKIVLIWHVGWLFPLHSTRSTRIMRTSRASPRCQSQSAGKNSKYHVDVFSTEHQVVLECNGTPIIHASGIVAGEAESGFFSMGPKQRNPNR